MPSIRDVGAKLARAVPYVRGELENRAYVPAGHYYSPRTSKTDVARAKAARRRPVGVDLAEAAQLDLAERLCLAVPPTDRWTTEGNTMFGPSDAAVLRAMLLHLSPRLVVEVGSGFSTAVMLDVAASELPGLAVRCIEPYTDRLRSRLRPEDWERLTLIERPVQDVAAEQIVEGLARNDVLFIDSTHVVKAGSDVLHLFLHTLPLLPEGVVVHVHDIFWPFEYPDEWLDHRRDWTESYLLHAFLMHNTDWEVMLFSSWLWTAHPEFAPQGTELEQPGSIWLRRRSVTS